MSTELARNLMLQHSGESLPLLSRLQMRK